MFHTLHIFLSLALLVKLTSTAVVQLRKPSKGPHADGQKIRSEKEHASDYVKDGNGKSGKSGSDVKTLQKEEEFHNDYIQDDRPAVDKEPVHKDHKHVGRKHEHGGSPGKGGGQTVPNTHVHGEKQAHHDRFHWTYSDPKDWGEGFKNCKGQAQSPINIETSQVTRPEVAGKKLIDFVQYKALDDRVLANYGHSIAVNGAFGTLKLPDGVYNAVEFHFHFPSEHEVNGKAASGELHIVHQKEGSQGTDDLAVIGILLEVGSKDKESAELAFFKNLGFDDAKLPVEREESKISQPVDLNAFSDELSGDFFHYDGSLTTPPCSQTVHWYVLKQPAAVTTGIVESFKAIFPAPANNRPVAPLNGRTVFESALEAGPNEFDKAKSAKSGSLHMQAARSVVFVAAAAAFLLGQQ